LPDAHVSGQSKQRRSASTSVQFGTTELRTKLALIGYRQASTHTLTEVDIQSMVLTHVCAFKPGHHVLSTAVPNSRSPVHLLSPVKAILEVGNLGGGLAAPTPNMLRWFGHVAVICRVN